MDIQRLIKSLKDKGINIVAKANSVTAGLIWGVEGVEKVPKLGEVLFYVVNGTRYGVKPKRGNKHDIDWYYKQLKMGMQGAKAYHAGLTQFLNTWIKKGELEVVFKGKATASASVNEDGIIDKVSLTAIRNYLEQNNIEFDLKQNGRIYTFSFDCGKLILDDNNQKVKAFFDGKVKEAKTMRELNDFFSKCKVVASVKLTEGVIDNVLLHELNLNADKKKEGDFTVWTLKAGKRDFANVKLNNITGLTRVETIYGKVLAHTITTDAEFRNVINKLISEKAIAASPRKYRPSIRERMDRDSYLDPMDFDITERKDVEAFNKFKKEVQSIELFGRRPFNAFAYLGDKPEDLKKAKTGSHKYIEDINLEFRNGYIQVKCSEIEMDRLDEVLSSLNEKYKFKVLDYVGNGKFEFSASFGGNQTLYVLKPDELNYTVKNLRTECRLIEKVTSPFYIEKIVASKKVTADLKEGEEYEEVDAFIKDVNNLTINGKKVFNAEKKGEDIVVNLLLKHFETPDMNRLNELVEDKLEILFPITQKWMDADKGQTFGNTKKVGDIVLYTSEWSSQEFADHLTIEDCSKIDWKNLPKELTDIYRVLKRDCSVLETNLFKVTADTVTVEVKETAEVNEENFEGINEEHDRLLFTKVTPEKFLNLWKTSKNFNGSQIQKIIYGFKLASRTLGSKFENKGILIEYFYSKKYGKGYIRVEYEKDLFIIYVAQSEDNGDIKVITRKMRKMIPTKNFNILSTSVNSLAFERASLPAGFKPVWEEVTQSK